MICIWCRKSFLQTFQYLSWCDDVCSEECAKRVDASADAAADSR